MNLPHWKNLSYYCLMDNVVVDAVVVVVGSKNMMIMVNDEMPMLFL